MENSISHWQRLLLQEVEEKQLSPKQQKIAKLDPPVDKIDSGDFKALRGGAKIHEEDEDHKVAGALNRLHKNKPLKTGDITTIKSGKYKGKKVKITADLGNGRYKIDLVNKEIKEAAPIEIDPYGEDPNLDIKADKDIPELGMTEEQDHEVSMANNSIESIIKAAMELKAKLGDDEKDIPAWIQDHITNAANFISQAADNYHEYGGEEKPEKETEDSLTAIMEKIIKNGRK
jgi:hypothetical protein